MNLAVRGIDADIRWNNEGSFHKDELKDLRFDYVLANPPFNVSDCPSSCPMNSASATPRNRGGGRMTTDRAFLKKAILGFLTPRPS
jgi:hypothetical protein